MQLPRMGNTKTNIADGLRKAINMLNVTSNHGARANSQDLIVLVANGHPNVEVGVKTTPSAAPLQPSETLTLYICSPHEHNTCSPCGHNACSPCEHNTCSPR